MAASSAGTDDVADVNNDDEVWARRRDVPDVKTDPTPDVTCDSINSTVCSEHNGINNSLSENSKHSTIEMKGDKSGAVYVSMDKQINNYPSASYKRLEHPADKSLLSSFFLSIIFLIVALALVCPVIGLVFVFVPLMWFIRRCMDCCCCTPQHICPCCSAIMTNSDSFWLHDSPLNHMVVQSLLVLENGLDLNRIKELLQARVIYAQAKNGRYIYPRFTHRIVELNASWLWKCDTSFSIDDHVFPVTTEIESSRQLQDYVSDFANRPLDMEKPLWEIHVISNYGEEKDTVLLFRMHPCMCDGVGMIRVLLRAVVDETLVPATSKVNFASRAFYFNVIRALIVGPLVFFHKFIFTRSDYNVFHGSKPTDNKVVVWSEAYSMASCTRIKQVSRSSMNDVFLAVVSGTLRTYQQHFGVEHPFDILCTLPLDFRNEMSPNRKVRMGNQIALVDVPLPTNTEGAIPRLWEVRHRMEELKNSADVPIQHGIMNIMMTVFPKCVAHFVLDTIYNHSSCFVSNLMGPTVEQTFAGRKIKDIIYWAPPRADVTLSISFITYGPQLRMAVLADRNIVPNPEILTQDFIAQMENFAKLLANRRIPGEHSTRRHGDLHHELTSDQPEPSIDELRKKMATIQIQLQEHKAQLDTATENNFMQEQENLNEQIENLRDEFRDLMIEIRRRRAQSESGGGVLSDEDDDEDGELRRASIRRRTLSSASRRLSLVSYASMARPLTTSSGSHRNSISPPSSPVNSSVAMKEDAIEPTATSIPDLQRHLVSRDVSRDVSHDGLTEIDSAASRVQYKPNDVTSSNVGSDRQNRDEDDLL